MQIGNCGSPIELDEGWLLLTHGVGPVRKYSIGAVLLDKADPSKVLARSREPLVRPDPSEREGYVPNVVYTCGAHAPWRSDRPALRGLRHLLQFRHDQDRLVTGESAGLTAEIARIDAGPACISLRWWRPNARNCGYYSGTEGPGPCSRVL